MELPARFWAKVNKLGPVPEARPDLGNCWLWTAYKTDRGYGIFNFQGKIQRAHRLAYAAVHGVMGKELEVDHKCFTRACVRESHLQAVTHKQNLENRPGAAPKSRSGIRGVNFHTKTGRWVVQATHHNKNYYGGLFTDLAEAEQAAIALRNKLFTHSEMDKV